MPHLIHSAGFGGANPSAVTAFCPSEDRRHSPALSTVAVVIAAVRDHRSITNSTPESRYGSIRLVYKPFVLICMADLLGEKNTIPWLIS